MYRTFSRTIICLFMHHTPWIATWSLHCIMFSFAFYCAQYVIGVQQVLRDRRKWCRGRDHFPVLLLNSTCLGETPPVWSGKCWKRRCEGNNMACSQGPFQKFASPCLPVQSYYIPNSVLSQTALKSSTRGLKPCESPP